MHAHALLLAVALGQATSTTPAATPATSPATSPATLESPSSPPAGPAQSPPLDEPTPATVGPSRRPVELRRLPDGSFRATLDGQPVAGAGFYRAVLRPDLAARLEEARDRRTALWVSAGLAPLFGAGVGWVTGTAQARSIGCDQPGPPVTDPGVLAWCEGLRRQNRSTVRRTTAAGGAVGLAAGLLLWLAGRAIEQPEPTADEAEGLVRAYRAGGPAAPAPVSGGASLLLETGPGTTRLAVRLGF